MSCAPEEKTRLPRAQRIHLFFPSFSPILFSHPFFTSFLTSLLTSFSPTLFSHPFLPPFSPTLFSYPKNRFDMRSSVRVCLHDCPVNSWKTPSRRQSHTFQTATHICRTDITPVLHSTFCSSRHSTSSSPYCRPLMNGKTCSELVIQRTEDRMKNPSGVQNESTMLDSSTRS
ncbi:hypothetical protein K504DRAFT_304913 [Pleomassaria siparia CBS 279.74]|uniref:Uncharacterized protein n=1 Tax=Pleomassaria siparia CBS 279.74 TaxID=1314801 RepID=A0A6G1K641_9PLEO|nr:hypothetical protein K504DRAFT_304913 [Pleomassaria siparia CBS 279.74]